jgi:dynein light intermediate chain 2
VVWHSGVNLVIAAAKADALGALDLEARRALARGLRYVAHSHGAHLCYLGGLAGGLPLQLPALGPCCCGMCVSA